MQRRGEILEAIRGIRATEPERPVVLAVLQNMWGPEERCPVYFTINPLNHSGRRLYKLIDGKARLRVTNAASLTTPTATGRQPTDLTHLQRALTSGKWDLVLVCGTQAALAINSLPPSARDGLNFFFIDHPAARRWTRDKIEMTRARIAEILALHVDGNGAR